MIDNGNAYLGRQPILDKSGEIYGYEFFFRRGEDSVQADFDDDLLACSRVMVNIMGEMGTEWLFGSKTAFINVSRRTLFSDFIELLPAKRVVLELIDGITDEDIPRCRELREKGYVLLVDLKEVMNNSDKTLPLISYVKADAREVNVTVLTKAVSLLSARGIKCIAEKVETETQHKACADIGFNHFQGYYFAKPETLVAKTVSPSQAVVIELLSLVSRGEDGRIIENGFKKDVTLSFKLLRYINSVGFGLSCEIQSIRHALTILGYQQLYRWLTLLLVTSGGKNNGAISRTAITRGRLCELLGAKYLSGKEKDNLFVVGVFSMLDVMLGMPMDKVLDTIAIPQEVCDVLIGNGGVYEPFLDIARACEENEQSRIVELAELMAMDPSFINKCHLEALAWTEATIP